MTVTLWGAIVTGGVRAEGLVLLVAIGVLPVRALDQGADQGLEDRDTEDLRRRIPRINDQVTNDRVRSDRVRSEEEKTGKEILKKGLTQLQVVTTIKVQSHLQVQLNFSADSVFQTVDFNDTKETFVEEQAGTGFCIVIWFMCQGVPIIPHVTMKQLCTCLEPVW